MLEQQQPINRSIYRKVDVDKFITKHCAQPSHKAVLYPKTELEDFHLNPVQKRLYREVMYGLRAYPAQKLLKLPDEKKEEISVRYFITRKKLNKWKQDMIRDVSVLALVKCWNEPLARLLATKGLETDKEFRVDITFRDLGVTRQEIIAYLIKCRILPRNFYELK